MPGVPLKPEVGLVDAVNEPPAPVITLHEPVPTVGAFAAKVAAPPQTVWSAPAFATVGAAVIVMTTSSNVLAQGALLIVQRKV